MWSELKGKLSAYCTHIKGHGGVKKSLRLLTRVIPEFRYMAALLDRITHHCDIIETGNDSYRFKHRKSGLKTA